RPLMAAVAEKNADRVVVTSDNPRSEKPEAIISQVLLGLSHRESVEVQADRAKAIAETVAAAAPQDVILLAGKGHEHYQEIAGVEVDDSKLALGKLANAWRKRHTLPLIAVTGSNGKTTVTQMIASILRAWHPDAHLATQGNLNNNIGLPLTLLRLRRSHRIGVI